MFLTKFELISAVQQSILVSSQKWIVILGQLTFCNMDNGIVN